MLYRYGLSLGIRLLLRGRLRWALPYLIRPVNYWRNVEYAAALRLGGFKPGQQVLDIGSPKLLALYLAEHRVQVTATDIDPYFVKKLSCLRELRGISSADLRLEVCDGRDTGFDDQTFDRVYSISVIEHIPDDGDADCMREIGRVLRPGGRCVITVPFWRESRVDYSDGGFYWAEASTRDDRGVFYQRRYSEDDLFCRLIRPSGMRVRSLTYVGERVLTASQREVSDYLPAMTGPAQPLLSRVLHVGPVDDWRSLEKPLCAVLSMEKTGPLE